MDKLIKELRLAQSETKKHMEKFYKENNTNQKEFDKYVCNSEEWEMAIYDYAIYEVTKRFLKIIK